MPRMRDEENNANLVKCGLKACDPPKPKKKDKSIKAHSGNPIKRGIPSSPRRLLKSLESWKNRDSVDYDVEIGRYMVKKLR